MIRCYQVELALIDPYCIVRMRSQPSPSVDCRFSRALGHRWRLHWTPLKLREISAFTSKNKVELTGRCVQDEVGYNANLLGIGNFFFVRHLIKNRIYFSEFIFYFFHWKRKLYLLLHWSGIQKISRCERFNVGVFVSQLIWCFLPKRHTWLPISDQDYDRRVHTSFSKRIKLLKGK